MSFDSIQLPSSVLSDLYKQVVVTDDFANMPGSPARKTEVHNPAVKATTIVEALPSQAGDTGSTLVSGTDHENMDHIASNNVTATIPQTQTTPVQPVSQPAANTKPNPAGGPVSDAPYRYLGKNARQVVIVVNTPTEPFLPEDQLQLLTKMLDACKLNLGDVAIVNHATQAVQFNPLNTQLQPRYTILFGVLPENIGLPLSFPPFKEQEYAGCTYLLASSLQAMNQPNEEGKSLKGKLWGCLKKMFNI